MKNILFLVVLFLFVGCGDTKIQDIEKNTNLEDLEGNAFDISQYKGKKVLINYWATWCAPCKKEMPNLVDAQRILSSDNYVFLLVSDESLELISDFKKTTNYQFTFLRSTISTAALGVYALPTTFIYNEKGEKVEHIIGAVEWNSEEMIEKLKKI